MPLSGVFRVMYFLATGVVLILVAVSAVASFYDPPGDDVADDGGGFEDTFVPSDESQQNYNRNVSLILQTTSAGLFTIAILAFGSRFNPLRAGIMLGGLGVYLTGVGFWANSSDQWLGFLLSVVNLAVLAVGFLWLEEGLPLGTSGEVRRLEIPPAGVGTVAASVSMPPPPSPPPPFVGPYTTSGSPDTAPPSTSPPAAEPPGPISEED
jgi:hypothetical protein